MKKSWANYFILLSFLLLISTNISTSSTYAKEVFQEQNENPEQVEPVQETEEIQVIEEVEQVEEVQQETTEETKTIEETEEEKAQKKQQELDEALVKAVGKANVDKALELIAKGANINSEYYYFPPLIRASALGHKEMVAALISVGADVNLVSEYSNPLSIAIKMGHVEIVQMLINAGAKVDAVYGEEANLIVEPAIMLLSQIEKPSNTFTNTYNSILITLLAAGADPNIKIDQTFHNEETFMTPLMTAVCLGNLEAASLLIACGADVNAKTNKGVTAYICAVKTNQQDMIELLKESGAKFKKTSKKTKYPDIPITEYAGKVAFIPGFGPTISSDDPLKIISECEGKEITDINAKNEYGETILMGFLRYGSHSDEYIKFLVQSGANLNLENNEGENALLMASGSGMYCISSLETLLRAGANVNIQDKDGKTPLMRYISANKGCSCSAHYAYKDFISCNEIIKLLILAGADINIQDKDGKTALMYAYEKDSNYDFFSLTKTLLELGADQTIKDKDDISFLDMLEGKKANKEEVTK